MIQLHLDHLLQAAEPAPPSPMPDRSRPDAFSDHLRQAGSPVPGTTEARIVLDGDGWIDPESILAESQAMPITLTPAVELTASFAELEPLASRADGEAPPNEETAARPAARHEEDVFAAAATVPQIEQLAPATSADEESGSVIIVAQAASDATTAPIDLSTAVEDAALVSVDGEQPSEAPTAVDDDDGEVADEASPPTTDRAIASPSTLPSVSPTEQDNPMAEQLPATATASIVETQIANPQAAPDDEVNQRAKPLNDETGTNRPAVPPEAAAGANSVPAAVDAAGAATVPAALAETMPTQTAEGKTADDPAGKPPAAESPRTDGILGSLARLSRSETSTTENPRIDAARFVERVAGAFRTAQDRGGPLQLRLSPPELGSLRMEVAVKDGALTATLETESAMARRVLLDQLPALRLRLAEQNIRIERFDVDVRQEHGGSGQEAGPRQQHHEQGQQPYDAPTRGHVSGSSAVEAPASRTSSSRLGNSALDLVI